MMMPNSYGTIQQYTPNREISGVTIPRISSYAYTGNTLQLSWHPGSKISGITVPPSRCWYLIHTVQFSNTGSWEVDTPNPTILESHGIVNSLGWLYSGSRHPWDDDQICRVDLRSGIILQDYIKVTQKCYRTCHIKSGYRKSYRTNVMGV